MFTIYFFLYTYLRQPISVQSLRAVVRKVKFQRKRCGTDRLLPTENSSLAPMPDGDRVL